MLQARFKLFVLVGLESFLQCFSCVLRTTPCHSYGHFVRRSRPSAFFQVAKEVFIPGALPRFRRFEGLDFVVGAGQLQEDDAAFGSANNGQVRSKALLKDVIRNCCHVSTVASNWQISTHFTRGSTIISCQLFRQVIQDGVAAPGISMVLQCDCTTRQDVSEMALFLT